MARHRGTHGFKPRLERVRRAKFAQIICQIPDHLGDIRRSKGCGRRSHAHRSDAKPLDLQAKARELADKFGYVEPNLWTGVGRARSGCGAALVGSTDQVMSKIEDYQKMGIRAFIFSGYPHLEEAKHFGARVMPHLKTCSLPHAYGRVPSAAPATPLAAGERR